MTLWRRFCAWFSGAGVKTSDQYDRALRPLWEAEIQRIMTAKPGEVIRYTPAAHPNGRPPTPMSRPRSVPSPARRHEDDTVSWPRPVYFVSDPSPYHPPAPSFTSGGGDFGGGGASASWDSGSSDSGSSSSDSGSSGGSDS